ncbi:hypothetical protein B0A53_03458 [Rhodotorula sp. CCFEE 5036]|nr:hypothetical protein B0A53_03458 [Rhodotorula sp. CCFEE 5036]
MPVHPEETTDSDDPQQMIDKFYEELAVSDQDLIRMDKGGFRNWMDAMTDGIACLAEQSLQANAPTDQELPKSSPARKSLDMVRIDRERHIEEWRKSWRTEDIQALMVQNLFLRPWYKPKFEYLAQLFKGLEWLLIIQKDITQYPPEDYVSREFREGLELSDTELNNLDKDKFGEWMTVMIDGIYSLVEG